MLARQSGTLYRSGSNYFDGDIIIQSGNFYFSFEGDREEIVTTLGNRIYLFSSPQFFKQLFEKRFRQTPVLVFEFRISWLARRQNYQIKEAFTKCKC